MRFTLSDTALQNATCELLAVPVPEPGTLGASAAAVDLAVGGRLSELVRVEGFTGKRGTTATLFAPDTPFRRVTLVGIGARPSPEALRRYAAVAVRRARD
ncbi:MAG TPA: M17 family peptidase N-terminal domain-containing protein, partial [bacterium]|nr:M17 family peptidase N-terminal domain-containing protein [bacterium]